MVDLEDILKFWFGDASWEPAAAVKRGQFWFNSNEAQDREVWSLFADSVADAVAGLYDAWASEPEGSLGLIILLDQFPRNIYRGTAEVFRHDARALELASDGVEQGQLSALSVPEQAFFLMPYQHSEDLMVQKASVELYDKLAANAAPEWHDVATGYRDFAVRHHNIIQRFSRFPHRNKALGRQPTEAETRYLAEGGDTFGQ